MTSTNRPENTKRGNMRRTQTEEANNCGNQSKSYQQTIILGKRELKATKNSNRYKESEPEYKENPQNKNGK